MPNLVKKVQNTIFLYNLFSRGDKILLAVSGGPDSVAMLDIFAKLQKKYDLELAVAHVNYGLRGRDSDADEKFVRELAKNYGLKIFILNVGADLASARKGQTQGLSLQKNISEDYLRNIRYDFFGKICKENNFNYISVAHNRDDQVETYLMRIIRGAGLKGLSAMQYKNRNIIRPLLNISRKEIVEYLKKNKLRYRIDKTNFESKYFRNKIRNKLIPYLEKNFNPQIRKTIFSSLESVADDLEYISQAAEKIGGKDKALNIDKIINLPRAIQRRVILRAILRAKLDLKDIESAHMNEIIKLIGSTKNKRQVMRFKGLKVERRGDKLTIVKLNSKS